MIFLDEPISGLDSEMACSLFCLLVDVCRHGRTICLSIHQPSSLITSHFDDFLLLDSGQLVYGGPYDKAVSAFASVGLQCPQYTNPTDYFLNVLKDPNNAHLLISKQEFLMKFARSLSQYADFELDEILDTNLIRGDLPCSSASNGYITVDPKVRWWYQVRILSSRSIQQYIRNPAAMFSETAHYLFMGIFIALMYLQVGTSVETGVQDRLGKQRHYCY